MIQRTSLILVAILAAGLGLAQQTENHELRAVPAPGKVVIDGKLGDWDLSGEIVCCYDLTVLKETHSVRAAAMCDAQYLYLSFRFKDPTPLVNHIDPKLEPGGGWKADAVQLRIKLDRVAHVTAWYYTDRREPAMSIHYGLFGTNDPDTKDLDDALAAGAREAFLADPDGRGYVHEMAIPWELLARDGHALKAGDHMSLGFELFWGSVKANDWPEHRYADLVNPQRPQREFFWTTPEAWGTLTFLARGKLAPSPSIKQLADVERQAAMQYSTAGPIALRYDLPADAAVTLVVEKPDGTRVRNLFGDYPRKAGRNTDYWDGADDAGHLVPPGAYRVRGLYHRPLDAFYDFAYGNPGDPPYDNSLGTGGWLSNHAPPMAVAAGRDRVYLTAAFAEGATAVLGADYEGRRQWGVGNINAGMPAEDGKYLYLLVGGPSVAWGGAPENEVAIVRLDAATGKHAPWPDGKSMHSIATIASWDQWFKPHRPEGELVATHGFDADWCQRQTLGLAVAGGKLYASLHFQNRVVVVDADKGVALAQIPLDRPAGLATDASGALFAISGKRVVKLTGSDQWTEVVRDGLSAPVGLACDAQGNLYVSDWGDAMCVKAFSPDGRLLRTIGKPGGRPLSGRYDPSGMFRPWGIAVDARGRLWVAEHDNSPRRLSVWDTATGSLVREFCGTTYYSATGAHVNPLDPRQAFVLGNTCALDWDKGTWRVTGTLFRRTSPDAWFDAGEGWLNGSQVVRRGDRTLLIASGQNLLCIAELHQYDARPLAVIGSVYGLYHGGELWPDLVVKHLAAPDRLAELKTKHPKAFDGTGSSYPDVSSMLGEPGVNQYFLWTDGNGDGLVQEPEIRFFTSTDVGGLRFGFFWGAAVDPRNFTFYTYGNGANQTVWKVPVREWNSAGAPVYDLAAATKIVDQPLLPQPEGPSEWADPQGNLVINQSPLQMFSPDGALLWSYPNPWPGVHGSHTAPAAHRGRILGPLYVLGSAQMPNAIGEVFCLGGNLGERYFLTGDGLFLGSIFADCRSAPEPLLDQPRRNMSIAACTAGGEGFGGEFFQHATTGAYYLGGPVASSREASVLARVTGLDTARRLPTQRLTVTAKDCAAARDFQARQAVQQAKGKALSIVRLKGEVKDLPDYGQFDFSAGHVARWSFDARHTASATWAYDDANLYLTAREVLDDTPMINSGADVRTLFKTGDAVEFELRTAPDDDSPQVIAGDLRLVLSVFDGKPVVVLYRYKVPGTAAPIPFASPVGTTKIDEVRVLDDARLSIDRYGGGYHLRAAIPLRDLGFAPARDKTYRGDFGIVYSDRGGKIDELRMYWANPADAMVNDLFSEAAINPAAWGRFKVEE